MTLNAVESIERETCRAPLLGELSERLGRERRRVILDIGPATPGTLAFLQDFRCRLLIADAAADIDALGTETDEARLAEQLAQLVPSAGDEPIDAVFCWGLFNYLPRPVLAALGKRLSEIVRPGAVAHGLVQSREVAIPATPARYAVAGAAEFSCDSTAPYTRKPSQYTPWDLERYSGHFKVDRSVMLANGMQEYLLRIESGSSAPREVKAVYQVGG